MSENSTVPGNFVSKQTTLFNVTSMSIPCTLNVLNRGPVTVQLTIIIIRFIVGTKSKLHIFFFVFNDILGDRGHILSVIFYVKND